MQHAFHFGARREQPEGCPWPSVALESPYAALFPLLPGPALWDPVLGALPRGGARCASGGPALAAALTPAGVRRGASGASPWCARRWGRAVQGGRALGAAGDCARAPQGGAARFLLDMQWPPDLGLQRAQQVSNVKPWGHAARRAGRRALHWRIAAQHGRGAALALRLPGVRSATPRWPAPRGSPRP